MLKVKVENPAALQFILQDDIYLLNKDKALYQNVAEPVPEVKTEQVKLNYLGQNKRNLLILTYYPDQEHILDVHQTALESVLKRKEHTLDDVAILNIYKYPDSDIKQLTAHFCPVTLLILGKNAMPAGFSQSVINKPAVIDGVNVLYTFSFDEMMTNNDSKKTFWEQVKTL